MVASGKTVLSFFTVLLIFLICFYYFQQTEVSDQSLRVYTYSSFTADSGPGKKLAELFNKKTGFTVSFISSDSALTMMNRFKNDKKKVDLFIGIDQFSKQQVEQDIEWLNVNFTFNKKHYPLFQGNTYTSIVPYNWAPMTFIYNNIATQPPISWREVSLKNLSISAPDPRTSSPGNVYLYWLYYSFQDQFVDEVSLLKKQTTWSPSWTTSYGLFSQDGAQLGFSYLTSLAYHKQQGELEYQAVSFETGHPIHIEYLGVPKSCRYCKQAKQFLEFLLSPEAQTIIMNKNYMFPVLQDVVTGTNFDNLPKLNLIPMESIQSYINNKKIIMSTWKGIHRE